MKRILEIGLMAVLGAALAAVVYISFRVPGGLGGMIYKRPDFTQRYMRQVGEPYPDLSFQGPDGKRFRLSQVPHKALLLDFFASWCAPCNAEARTLEYYWERYHAKGLLVVGVDLNESPDAATRYRLKYQLTFPVLLDQSVKDFTIPYNVVVDEKGVVRFSRAGSNAKSRDLEQVLTDVLGSTP